MINTERLLRHYYLATPAFVLVDVVFGENVRTAGFQNHPVLKFLYYSVCFGCFFAMRAKPNFTGLITQVESGINITSLILAFMVPYYSFVGQIAQENYTASFPITPQSLVNFCIAGFAACLSFYGADGSGRLLAAGSRR